MNTKLTRRHTILAHSLTAGLPLFLLVLVVLLCLVKTSYAEQPVATSQKTTSLSLSGAIARALENNIIVRLAHERIEEAKGLRLQSKSDFLPHIALNVSQDRIFWENLSGQGLPEAGVLGPFNSFDARVQLVQRVFDFSALSGLQAENAALKITSLEEGFARQQIILSAVFSYLDVLDKKEKLRAVEENMSLAQQLVTMAQHQLSAGIVTEIDVIRAKTRLAQQKAHRQDVLQSLDAAYLRLMYTTGLPLETQVRLTDSMHFFEEKALTVVDALDTAFKDRIEMSLSKEKVRYQQHKLSQAKNERLPALNVYGNYGRAGETSTKFAEDVGAIGVKFTMPVFEGGEINGRIREERSRKRSEELKRDDTQVQVEEDVRLALQTLVTGADRVKAAKETFDLAKREVELAQNQYRAGTENNIAVIEAQAVLAGAHETYITSMMQYHLARANYFSALGQTKSFYLNPATGEEEKR